MAANAREPSRNGGFMLVHQACDLFQRKLLAVVVAEQEPVARVECPQGGIERGADELNITRAARLGRVVVFVDVDGLQVFVERIGPPRCADIIDMTLSEHGAEPGEKGTSAVEVVEEGTAAPAVDSKRVPRR